MTQEDFKMNWLLLLGAGAFEVVWTVALKKSDGFRNVWVFALVPEHITGKRVHEA